MGSGRSPEQLLVALGLYSTATVFFRSRNLLGRLYRSHDLATFLHLPIEDALIFRFEWDKFLRASVWLFYVSFLVYGYLAFGHLHRLGPWAAFGFVFVASLLQWLTALSLATLLARYRPAWAPTKVGLVLDAFIVVMFYLPSDVVRQCQTVLLAAPGGWITHAFGKALVATAADTLPFWGAALLVAALLPFAMVGLRKTYSTETLTPSRFGIPTPAGEEVLEEAVPVLGEAEFGIERGPTSLRPWALDRSRDH
jgi:hypothetical protein